MENNNEQFDDLFQDFFGAKMNNLKKQVVDNDKHVVPKVTSDKEKNIGAVVDELLSPNDKHNEPRNLQRKEAPREIDLPQSTIPKNSQIQKALPNNELIPPNKGIAPPDKVLAPPKKELIPLNRNEKNNIEGGSSTYITNPESLIPRTPEVDEILSYVPSWMIRWGITTIFVILMGIITMSYFVKYPDIVNGIITITSNTPPATILAKTNGALKLYKKNKDIINEGEVIALIKNDAQYKDIQELKISLEYLKVKLDKKGGLNNFSFPKSMDLGSLQGSFLELLFSLKNKQAQTETRDNNNQRKENINQKIVQIKAIEREQKQQIETLKLEYLRVKEVHYKRYQPLFENGIISAEELESKLSEVTRKHNAYQNAKSSIGEYYKRILDLEAQKDELDFKDNQVSNTNFNSISIAYSKLVNDINSWENQFLLTAPIDGRLNYLQFVKDNINVARDQEIASFVPITEEGRDKFAVVMGELFIGSEGVGKVDVGQIVNVELDAYLKKEYGIIEGKVLEIADVATTMPSTNRSSAFYKVLVGFKEGFKPTTGKEIIVKHNMKGKAKVITEDVRLIERIFNELRDVVDAK